MDEIMVLKTLSKMLLNIETEMRSLRSRLIITVRKKTKAVDLLK